MNTITTQPQAAIGREVAGRYAFGFYPHEQVKRLAKRLEGIDLLRALVLADRLRELLGLYAIGELCEIIGQGGEP